MGGYLGGVGKGFVIHTRQAGNDIQGILGGDEQLGVIAAQVLCDIPGIA